MFGLILGLLNLGFAIMSIVEGDIGVRAVVHGFLAGLLLGQYATRKTAGW